MLRYLDNAENAKGHLNEIDARGIMELHTMAPVTPSRTCRSWPASSPGVDVNFQPPDPNAMPKLSIMAQPDYVRARLFEFNPNRHDYGVEYLSP
jgi:Protein of unknown function (DUF1800)